MKTARLFINKQSITAELLLFSVEAIRAPFISALHKHNQPLYQQVRKEATNTLRTLANRCPTPVHTHGAAFYRGNYRRSFPTQTAGIKSHASYSTEATILREPTIHSLYDEKTGTWQYLIADPSTSKAVIIDSVLDFDPGTQAITTPMADSLLKLVIENGYIIEKILETHAHADHLTAASYLQSRISQQQDYRPPICIGKRITQVQDLFGQRYGIPIDEYKDVFDKLFDDDESFEIGNLTATIIHLPGHTPDHIGYKIGDNVFCGDSLFNTDIGTARCDFPGGSATSLYKSGRKLLQLPDHVKIWTGHDYPSAERSAPVPWMTVRDHKARNKYLSCNVKQSEFVSQRMERDATLVEPSLLNPALQINIRAGRLPYPTMLGHRFLHLPLKLNGKKW